MSGSTGALLDMAWMDWLASPEGHAAAYADLAPAPAGPRRHISHRLRTAYMAGAAAGAQLVKVEVLRRLDEQVKPG